MMNGCESNLETLWSSLSGAGANRLLLPHYGEDFELVEKKQGRMRDLLQVFQRSYPDSPRGVLLRVPGRTNLMGVHVDHRGGWCNYLPIARETLLVAAPRNDDWIVARNGCPEYPECTFSLQSELPFSRRGRWMEYIESVELERGSWGNYLKAGALKLQDRFPEFPLHGVNLTIDGDIPPRSGLSSSSTLVVGTMMALCLANGLSLSPYEMVELCGEGEWYVGTRGGCGDHAAMIFGRLHCITHIAFRPLAVSFSSFPSGVDVILAQSGIQAHKAAGARETFNARIAAYEAAFAIYRDAHPHLRDRLVYLRDIAPESLGMNLSEFYTSLKAVPISVNRDELRRGYPHLQDTWHRIFSTYGEPAESLRLREILLFGVAECDRARRFSRLLEEGQIDRAGQLMYISHDGDRVCQWKGGHPFPFRSPFDNGYLDRLSDEARLRPEDESVSLAWQAGGYRCSVPELDRIVDCCQSLEGVLGAGLTGAGLGGSVLVLVRKEFTPHVIEVLRELIAQWHPGEPWVERCQPVAGASQIQDKDI